MQSLKILVAIANHGNGNRQFLDRLLHTYQTMNHRVHVVILSNIPKSFCAGIEVLVGVPSKDPWSLPFAHKQVFCDRVDEYDLFIYSEDDTLITERNIDAFIHATGVLPENELAGFLRTERSTEDTRHFPEVHAHFRWDPQSVRICGSRTFAHYTDEHSACFMLTQTQLKRAISSGGFLVVPHEERYDLMVTAATDPYTQCGFRKMICISHLDDFTVPHLPNKYIGRIGVPEAELRRQIDVLLASDKRSLPEHQLFPTETKLPRSRWSKSYYEKHCSRLTGVIPEETRTILSIGMGWGETEEVLLKAGKSVTGIPLDSVIAACAAARGVEVIYGGFEEARAALGERRFDCLLLSNVLHLVEDPGAVLKLFCEVLAEHGVVLAKIPNLAQLPILARRWAGKAGYRQLSAYDRTGIHLSSTSWLRGLLEKLGLHVTKTVHVLPDRHQLAGRTIAAIHKGLVASDIIMCASR